MPVEVKYLSALVTAFPIIILLYEYVVRRSNIPRFLFGLKAQQKAALSGITAPKAA